MARQVTTDQVLRVVGSLFLALLLWQGNQICARVDALEHNQTLIMVHLGIPPVASDTLGFGVKSACAQPPAEINEIKPLQDTPKKKEFYP